MQNKTSTSECSLAFVGLTLGVNFSPQSKQRKESPEIPHLSNLNEVKVLQLGLNPKWLSMFPGKALCLADALSQPDNGEEIQMLRGGTRDIMRIQHGSKPSGLLSPWRLRITGS